MGRGGKRPGAGRHAGTQDPQTIERAKVLEEYRKKVIAVADVLFRSQLHLAKGQTYLFKIEKKLVLGPKGGKKYLADRPKMVTDPQEMENYLAGLIQEGEPDDEDSPDSTYYFITAKDPDNKAIDSMLDRTFGKPAQPIAGDPENPITLQITGMTIAKEK